MFVRGYSRPFVDPAEISLYAIRDIIDRPRGSKITTGSEAFLHASHPAGIVRKALAVYAGCLGGVERSQVDLPGMLDPANLLGAIHPARGLVLDLTGDQIQIVEEISPVDSSGVIRLDATQTRILRTFQYEKASAFQPAAAQDSAKKYEIGEKIFNGAGSCVGIFLGIYDLAAAGERFRIIAAPQDLTGEKSHHRAMAFQDTVARLNGMSSWYGYPGRAYERAEDLRAALADGSYGGQWVIPPLDILCGRSAVAHALVQPDNLHAHKDTGAFKGTFTTDVKDNSNYRPSAYWSCTRNLTGNPIGVRFAGTEISIDAYSVSSLSCRPVRFEALIA